MLAADQILRTAALIGRVQLGIIVIIIIIIDVVDEEMHSVLFCCKNKSIILIFSSVKFGTPSSF